MEIKTDLHKIEEGLTESELKKAYKILNVKREIPEDFEIEGYWSTCQAIVCGEWFFEFL